MTRDVADTDRLLRSSRYYFRQTLRCINHGVSKQLIAASSLDVHQLPKLWVCSTRPCLTPPQFHIHKSSDSRPHLFSSTDETLQTTTKMQLFDGIKKVRFAVPGEDDTEHEGLVSKEQDSFDIEYHRLRQRLRILKGWIVGLSIVLAITSITLTFSLVEQGLPPSSMNRNDKTPIPHCKSNRHEYERPLTLPVPIKPVTFNQNESFAALVSQESDNAWGAMMPYGDGFVVVDDPKSYNLPPGKDTVQGEVYDTSLFHQLHCLAGIRTFLSTMKQAIELNNSLLVNEIILDPRQDHMAHCFDYLRQSLMCHGDMTLEWPRTEADGSRFAVDGWGIEHQCRDWVGSHFLHTRLS